MTLNGTSFKTAMPWSDDDLRFIRKHYRSFGAKEIARRLRRPFWGVARKASRLGLKSGPRENADDVRLAESLSEIDAAYLAGIVDGEGTIGMKTYAKRKAAVSYLSVASTDERLTDWIRSKVGGYVSGGGVRKNPRHRPVFQWHTERVTHLLAILSKIGPYLVIKREHVEIVALACVIRLSRPRASRTTEEEMALLVRLHPLQLKRKKD